MTTTAPSEPKSLTAQQFALLCYAYAATRDQGYQPSVREICDHAGFRSPNAVSSHFRALARKGWVALPGKAGPGNQMRAVRFLFRPDGRPFLGFADKTPLEVELTTAHKPCSWQHR